MLLLNAEGWLYVLRWVHLFFGIIWLGSLYHINFVQAPVLAQAEPPVANRAIQQRSLLWSRWGAMLAFCSGWPILFDRFVALGGWSGFFSTSYGWTIGLASILASVMWANVWFVTWPNQKILIANAAQLARGGDGIKDAPARQRRVAIITRTNSIFSIPMLFFMGASHLPLQTPASPFGMTSILAVIIGAVELNALVGVQGFTKKILNTGIGTLWSGLILTAIFWLVFEFFK